MTDETENNVFKMLKGGKVEAAPVVEDDTTPQHPYVIVDTEGNEHYAEGFLLFTSQHIAIMRDHGKGALPVLVIPLDKVAFAELVEEDETDDLPF